MTDKQFVGIIIGFVATALSSIASTLIALLINNSRLTDVKETLRAESKADSAGLREGILTQMATYQLDIISKIADLDNRITRLER